LIFAGRNGGHGLDLTPAVVIGSITILDHPADVFGQTAFNFPGDNLRNVVRMERSKFGFELVVYAGCQFENDERFVAGLHLPLPAVDGMNRRENVTTGGQIKVHEFGDDATRGLDLGKSRESDENLLVHWLGCGSDGLAPFRKFMPADPAAADHDIVVINHGGLSRSHGALWFVQPNVGALIG
jgi:hypothetical protein